MKSLLILLLLFLCSPVFGAPKVAWLRDFDQAMEKAQDGCRPIFVDVFADWCTWCHKLDREVYTDPKFVKYMEKFVPVKIDAEDNRKGTRFASTYRVEGFPTILITDCSGKLTNRIGGFINATTLISEVESVGQLLDKEQKHPEDIRFTVKLAEHYLSNDMTEEAELRLRKIVHSTQASAEEREKATFSLALANYYLRDLQEAEKALAQYLARYDNGKMEEDALLLLSQIYIETESIDRARDYLKDFLKKYPKSGNAVRAKETLALLEKELAETQN